MGRKRNICGNDHSGPPHGTIDKEGLTRNDADVNRLGDLGAKRSDKSGGSEPRNDNRLLRDLIMCETKIDSFARLRTLIRRHGLRPVALPWLCHGIAMALPRHCHVTGTVTLHALPWYRVAANPNNIHERVCTNTAHEQPYTNEREHVHDHCLY